MPEKEVTMPDEVVVTDPEGKILPDNETQELLKSLQAGVFYLPQNS